MAPCPGLSFQGCLCSPWSWGLGIVSPAAAEADILTIQFNKLMASSRAKDKHGYCP